MSDSPKTRQATLHCPQCVEPTAPEDKYLCEGEYKNQGRIFREGHEGAEVITLTEQSIYDGGDGTYWYTDPVWLGDKP